MAAFGDLRSVLLRQPARPGYMPVYTPGTPNLAGTYRGGRFTPLREQQFRGGGGAFKDQYNQLALMRLQRYRWLNSNRRQQLIQSGGLPYAVPFR